MRHPRHPRSRRGFSLVEVLISSTLLSIGAVAVTSLHATSLREVRKSRTRASAEMIAVQHADLLGTQQVELMSAATCPQGGGPKGCLSGGLLAPVKTCTKWVDDDDVPPPTGTRAAGTGSRGYRIDTVTSAHPDSANHGDSFLLTVSVCWYDDRGVAQQTQETRLLVPGT